MRDIPERLNWRDLGHLLRNQGQESALQREMAGMQWSTTDMLLVVVINNLRAISWQLGGGKARDRPKPFLLPGMEGNEAQPSPELVGDAMTIEDFERWYRESR